MDRQAFRNRMQQLKQYREQNPGKTYLDWKNSLPNNLQDDSDYNLHRAYELGYTPEWNETDKSYHLPTRDSETGEILKKPWHPTFIIGLQEDAKLGYYPQTINGTTYTTTWEGNENPIYKYANGGELEASLPEITVTAKRVRPRIPGDITSQVQPLDMPTQLQPNTVDNNTYSGNNLDEVNVVANRVNKQAPNGIIANMIRTDMPRVNKLRPFNSLEQPSIVDNDLVITDQPDRLGDETITTELPFITNDLEITDTPDKLGSETILGDYGKRRYNSRYTSNFQDERDWLANFATERSKLPEFADQLDTDQLTAYLDRIYNTPVLVQDAEVYSGPANSSGVTVFSTDKDIDYAGSDFYDTGASIKVMKDPTVIGNIIEYSKDLPSNVLHELEHSGQISTRPSMYRKEGFSKRVQKAADILGYDLNTPSSEYTNNPWEVLARRQQMFKEINADPTKKYTKKDLKSIRSYLKKYDLNHLGDDKILQLLNNVASIDNRKGDFDIPMAAEGGEIPPTNRPIIPEEPQPYKGKLYKDRYGRKYTEDQLADYYDNSTDEIDRFTGKPFIRGLKPVGDLEDAANVTPVGDAISAYGVYNAIKNSDWEGAGLAALGLMPFMSTGNKLFKRSAKASKSRYIPKVDPKYKQMERPTIAAQVTPAKGTTMYFNRDIIKKPKDIPDNVVLHEMGHLVDGAAGMNNEFLKRLGNKNKFIPFNQARTMYPEMTQELYNEILQGTEIKSYMNQFRSYLQNKGKLNKGNYTEGHKNLRKEIIEAPKGTFNNIKAIFNLYKSPKLFNKDFNMIPIVSTNSKKDIA